MEKHFQADYVCSSILTYLLPHGDTISFANNTGLLLSRELRERHEAFAFPLQNPKRQHQSFEYVTCLDIRSRRT